jgi:hypothetical protein
LESVLHPDALRDNPTLPRREHTIHDDSREIDADLLKRIGANEVGLLVYSFTEYLDVFGEVHRSECAYNLYASPDGRTLWFGVANVHNGMDEDCFHKPSKEYWEKLGHQLPPWAR